MSSAEFSEWAAYATLNPINLEQRADWRAGMLAATMANVHRSKDRDPYQPTDFMPVYGPAEPTQPQSVDDQRMLIEMLNAAFGGVDLRQKAD